MPTDVGTAASFLRIAIGERFTSPRCAEAHWVGESGTATGKDEGQAADVEATIRQWIVAQALWDCAVSDGQVPRENQRPTFHSSMP